MKRILFFAAVLLTLPAAAQNSQYVQPGRQREDARQREATERAYSTQPASSSSPSPSYNTGAPAPAGSSAAWEAAKRGSGVSAPQAPQHTHYRNPLADQIEEENRKAQEQRIQEARDPVFQERKRQEAAKAAAALEADQRLKADRASAIARNREALYKYHITPGAAKLLPLQKAKILPGLLAAGMSSTDADALFALAKGESASRPVYLLDTFWNYANPKLDAERSRIWQSDPDRSMRFYDSAQAAHLGPAERSGDHLLKLAMKTGFSEKEAQVLFGVHGGPDPWLPLTAVVMQRIPLERRMQLLAEAMDTHRVPNSQAAYENIYDLMRDLGFNDTALIKQPARHYQFWPNVPYAALTPYTAPFEARRATALAAIREQYRKELRSIKTQLRKHDVKNSYRNVFSIQKMARWYLDESVVDELFDFPEKTAWGSSLCFYGMNVPFAVLE